MLKNLTIKSKILFITLFGLLLLSSVLGYVSVSKAKESLIKKSYDMLTSTRDNKAKQVKNYLEQRIKDIKVLSKSSNADELLYDLGNLYDDLDLEEDEIFDVSIVSIKDATTPHENFFQNFAKEYGYNDIYLINAESGHVLYTSSKLKDYGSNLKFGNLKSSPLAQVWKKTLESKEATFIDMTKYSINDNKPTMFLGAPVFQDEEIKGVIVFQISTKDINDIMSFRKGYTKSQEDYLVGQDYLMRSNSYLDPKNHSLNASFSNKEKGKVDGIVYGGTSRKIRNYLQISNKLFVSHSSKSENKIGYFKTELIKPISPLYFNDKERTSALISICSLLNTLLPEAQQNKKIYNSFEKLINSINLENWIFIYIFFELNLIKDLGYDTNLEQYSPNESTSNDISKIKIDGYIYEVPNFLIFKKIPVKFDNTLIRKSLYFTRNVLQNKFFIPNNLLFPKSRVVLENYFN